LLFRLSPTTNSLSLRLLILLISFFLLFTLFLLLLWAD
jgi:hypothetical protein